jgi:hypothetical protein
MLRLMDDFTHIGFACTRFQANPEDRFAVVGLNCLLGENITHTRIASLIVILLTLILLDRAFFQDRNWRRTFLTILHPLILIPFFWASQISTSLTTLFAAAWVYFWIRWIDPPNQNRPLWAWFFLPVAGACILVRQETIAYCAVFALIWAIQNRSKILQNPKRPLLALALSIASFQAAKKIFFKSGFTTLETSPLIRNIADSFGHASSPATQYPIFTWPILQLDSALRYLEGLLLPWRASFYGNWYKWWEIHLNPLKTALQFAGAAFLLFIALLLGRHLLRKKGNHLDSIFRLVMGFLFFIGSALLLSAAPRSDWYYPARAYLGTLAFFVWVSPLLIRNTKTFAISLAILLVSTIAHVSLHFQNESSFLAYETEMTGADHPYLDLMDAELKLKNGKGAESIPPLFRIYQKIPVDSTNLSLRAGFFWSEGLYEAWRTYSILGNETKAMEVYRVLRNSTYFQSAHACLQIPSIPVEECLKDDRKSHFCDSLNFEYSKVKLARPYRIEPEKICGFRPVQGE